ncbi:MAG: cupin domain-containing protein [Acidimicrobiia bacterium]|nr:cupin domain-containing protein [Acidimicrobiia bacterium]
MSTTPDTPARTRRLSETEFSFAPTGERFVLRSDPSDTSVLAFDFYVEPGGGVKDNHRHRSQSEHLRCISGTLDVTVNGAPAQLGPGDEVDLPPGTLHTLQNLGDTEVHCHVEYRPAGRNREWFQMIAAYIDRTGKEPGLLDLAPFLVDVDLYLGMPVWFQRIVLKGILGPIGTLLGRRRRMLACAAEAYGRPFTW